MLRIHIFIVALKQFKAIHLKPAYTIPIELNLILHKKYFFYYDGFFLTVIILFSIEKIGAVTR